MSLRDRSSVPADTDDGMDLDANEAATLAGAERVIEQGIRTFVDVGNALAGIRDGRLYREHFASFEDYCRERWGFSDSRARQLILAAGTVTNVTALGAPTPTTESQARELAGLDPHAAADVLRRADQATGGRLTAAAIREARTPEPAPLDTTAADLAEFPALAYYAETGRAGDVPAMANDLRRYRERGELDDRLDNLRRSIAVDRSKRDGTYRPARLDDVLDDPAVNRARYRATLMRGIKAWGDITGFDSGDVAEAMTPDISERIEATHRMVGAWVARVQTGHGTGLRVVQGGES